MNDPTELRKYIHNLEDEETLRLLWGMFGDALGVIHHRREAERLENQLFDGDRMEHMMTMAPFEEDEEALHMAVTILKGKVEVIEEDRKEREEAKAEKEAAEKEES